jgi:hypothetical protein
VPRVSTSLGHLSMSVPRVSTSLVHLTHVGPTYLTSGSHLCHVTVNQWSMSAATSPGRYKWPDLIGPHHRPHHHSCHMAICEWSTPARDMPHGTTIEGHLNSWVPRGTSLLVHLSQVGSTTILTWHVGPTNMPRGKPWQSHLSTHMTHGSTPSNTPQQIRLFLLTHGTY